MRGMSFHDFLGPGVQIKRMRRVAGGTPIRTAMPSKIVFKAGAMADCMEAMFQANMGYVPVWNNPLKRLYRSASFPISDSLFGPNLTPSDIQNLPPISGTWGNGRNALKASLSKAMISSIPSMVRSSSGRLSTRSSPSTVQSELMADLIAMLVAGNIIVTSPIASSNLDSISVSASLAPAGKGGSGFCGLLLLRFFAGFLGIFLGCFFEIFLDGFLGIFRRSFFEIFLGGFPGIFLGGFFGIFLGIFLGCFFEIFLDGFLGIFRNSFFEIFLADFFEIFLGGFFEIFLSGFPGIFLGGFLGGFLRIFLR